MSMSNYDVISIAFEVLFFFFLTLRLYSLGKQYIIPLLKEEKENECKKVVDLTTEHGELALQKKAIATQFLHQEKQIALLASKLERWYVAWQKKEADKQRQFTQHGQVAIEQLQRQYKNFFLEKQYINESLQLITELKKELETGAHEAFQKHYFDKALAQFNTISTLKEQSK